VLGVEDWAEIRRLHRAEQMPIKAIARVTGVSRNTVRRALAAEGPPRYQRPVRGSVVDAVEPQIRELLRVWPTMPATVIAERIGWQRSIRVLRDRVAELRPVYLPPDPASRTAYAAGELAQCDLWFPPVTAAGGVRADPLGDPAAGAGDGQRLLALVERQAAAVAGGRGPVRRLVAAHQPAWRGAEGAGLGPGGRGRQAPPPGERADRGGACLPWGAGRPDRAVRPGRPRGQGTGGARQRLPGDLLPARSDLHQPGGLQRPAGGVAGASQPAITAGLGLCAGRAHRGRPCGHAAAAAGRASHRMASRTAAGPRPLRAPGR
jgi:Helix-turn-helix domain of resolvase